MWNNMVELETDFNFCCHLKKNVFYPIVIPLPLGEIFGRPKGGGIRGKKGLMWAQVASYVDFLWPFLLFEVILLWVFSELLYYFPEALST